MVYESSANAGSDTTAPNNAALTVILNFFSYAC
jgi:hypothetical protein